MFWVGSPLKKLQNLVSLSILKNSFAKDVALLCKLNFSSQEGIIDLNNGYSVWSERLSLTS